MSFTLEIEFVGLCLFVPVTEPAAMKVLMPSTCHTGSAGDCHGATPGVDEHVLRLCVDTAYLHAGSTEASGIMALVPVGHVQLALGGTAPPILTLPPEVVHVHGDETKASIFA